MDRGPSENGQGQAELDEALLTRVRDRDPQAMNRFFDTFYRRVYAYAVRLLRNETLAEDLTQEAFLRMHGALERLDPRRDPTPWVFTIVTNVVRDHWRSRVHKVSQQQVPIDEAWQMPSSDGRTPEEDLERSDLASMVQRAMGRLSPADREILLLKAFRNLDTAEVVEVLEISPEAVRQRYSRAVKRLGVAYREMTGSDQVST